MKVDSMLYKKDPLQEDSEAIISIDIDNRPVYSFGRVFNYIGNLFLRIKKKPEIFRFDLKEHLPPDKVFVLSHLRISSSNADDLRNTISVTDPPTGRKTTFRPEMLSSPNSFFPNIVDVPASILTGRDAPYFVSKYTKFEYSAYPGSVINIDLFLK